MPNVYLTLKKAKLQEAVSVKLDLLERIVWIHVNLLVRYAARQILTFALPALITLN